MGGKGWLTSWLWDRSLVGQWEGDLWDRYLDVKIVLGSCVGAWGWYVQEKAFSTYRQPLISSRPPEVWAKLYHNCSALLQISKDADTYEFWKSCIRPLEPTSSVTLSTPVIISSSQISRSKCKGAFFLIGGSRGVGVGSKIFFVAGEGLLMTFGRGGLGEDGLDVPIAGVDDPEGAAKPDAEVCNLANLFRRIFRREDMRAYTGRSCRGFLTRSASSWGVCSFGVASDMVVQRE